MSDKLHRFFLENLNIRGEWVSLKKSWHEIQNAANYPAPVRHVLGEALAAVSLLAESLKFDGSLTLQIRGTQPVTMLVVQASSEGDVRGIAKWQGDIPNTGTNDATLSELFGAGTMVISVENNPKSGAKQGEQYQSLVSLEGESLAACLKEYFAQSEQLETQLWLAVDNESVAGLMLQSVPNNTANKANVDIDPQNNWDHATILADSLSKEELLTLDVKTLLHRLYHEEDLRLYDAKPLRFKCSCSQAKIDQVIYALGETDANVLIKEQGTIGVDCEFCNKHYALDKIDVARLFSNGVITDSSDKKMIH
ncbi:MAG TPA: Hsp33 family molecular chaperone HslO [Leucothrix sp.]|nr:Hsp33 family molecular chaperone HslO [Leucothrix sp.]